jgi:NADPH:quinone reductase-like Zn-dependent oxidoreductase
MRGWVGTAIWNKPDRLARTFPLAQIAEAHRFLESNEQVGKIVVTV